MSQYMGRYRLASQDIVCEEFDGEMVILDLGSGNYFALNRSASILIQGLFQGFALEALSGLGHSRFSTQTATDFFGELIAHELIVKDDAQQPIPMSPGFQTTAASLQEKPVLEIHADLADLIIADPIHDSDEMLGWPAQKAA